MPSSPTRLFPPSLNNLEAALLQLLGRRALMGATDLLFQRHCLTQRQVKTVIKQALVCPHGRRIAALDVARQLKAGRQQRLGRHNTVDQPPRAGLLRTEIIAGQRQLLGAVDANEPRQTL